MALSSWHQRVVVTVTWHGQIGASYERWALIGCSDIMDHQRHYGRSAPRTKHQTPRDLVAIVVVVWPRGDFDSCGMSSGSSRACNDFISTVMNELWFGVVFIMRIFVWDSQMTMKMIMMLHSKSEMYVQQQLRKSYEFPIKCCTLRV